MILQKSQLVHLFCSFSASVQPVPTQCIQSVVGYCGGIRLWNGLLIVSSQYSASTQNQWQGVYLFALVFAVCVCANICICFFLHV